MDIETGRLLTAAPIETLVFIVVIIALAWLAGREEA